MNLTRFTPVIDGSDRSLRAGTLRRVLAVAEHGYRLGVRSRNGAFDAGRRKPVHLGRPTISVGNITTGGTGKTPMVIDLARRLESPGVLLRGYHGPDETDELHDALAGHGEVEPNPDRVAGARALLERSPKTRVLLLDDGFQHRQVHRDLDLVLIDAMRPFGYEHLLPRGLLREPSANLKRASAVVVTRCDRVSDDELSDLDDRIAELTGSPPIAHTAHRWLAYRTEEGDIPVDSFRGRAVGVCGIGNPDAFEQTLRQHVGRVQAMAVFEDHHRYTRGEIEAICRDAKRDFADAVVVTEKDYVKWRPLLNGVHPPLPILRPVLNLVYVHGEDALRALVRKAVR